MEKNPKQQQQQWWWNRFIGWLMNLLSCCFFNQPNIGWQMDSTHYLKVLYKTSNKESVLHIALHFNASLIEGFRRNLYWNTINY